jgi:tetratricopeptide (TPR) repeat protein
MQRHILQRRSLQRNLWRPQRRWRVLALLKNALKQITFVRAAVAIFAVPFVIYVYREVTRDVLIIDPFTVPKSFEELGLTPEVMANRIGDHLREIEATTKTRMKKDALTSMQDQGATPDVEIPGTKLGMKSIIEITQSLFGIYPRHVSGDITLATSPPAVASSPSGENRVQVTIYVTMGRDRSQPVRAIEDDGNADSVAHRTAEMVLGQVNPYVFAAYLRDQKRYDEAIETIQGLFQNLSLDTRYRENAINLWGNLLADQNRYPEAIAKYEEAIELNPKDAYPYNGWGTALNAQSKYDEAIVKFKKAVSFDPKFVDCYNNWGNALNAEGKNDQAIVKFHQAIDLDPKYGIAYNGWGNALSAERRYDEAIVEYKKATDIDPRYTIAYLNWGVALNAQRRYDEAIVEYKRAVDLDPKYARAHLNWGITLGDEKRYDDAIIEYKKVVDLDPKYAVAHVDWGVALNAQRRYDEAIAEYKKATELDPKDEYAYNNWGNALYGEGKYDEAIAKYMKAAEIEPKYANAYRNWADALKAQGKYAKADQMSAKADELLRAATKP